MYTAPAKNLACNGEDHLFELQNAVDWRMVMSRGPDERTHMHSMSYSLNTSEGLSHRDFIDDSAAWAPRGNEQQQRD